MKRPADKRDKRIAAGVLVIVVGFHGFLIYVASELTHFVFTDELKLSLSAQIVVETYLYWFVFVALGVGGFALIFWRNDRRGWYFLNTALLSAVVLLLVIYAALTAGFGNIQSIDI